MAIASPWLSQWAFDSPDYVWGFVWLGLAVLFRQLTAGNLAILQGFRRLKWLANANVIGNTVGLGLTLPLYYFLGLEGIVPAIIGLHWRTVAVVDTAALGEIPSSPTAYLEPTLQLHAEWWSFPAIHRLPS